MPSEAEAVVGESSRSIQSKLAGVAGYVAKLPRGERAQLRRLGWKDDRLPPEVFWRLVQRYEIPPREEEFWIAILPLMIEHEHRPGVRAGRVLRAAGVAEQRVERWLRLDKEAAWREARRFMSKAGSGFDWSRLGALLYFWSEKGRMAFAREFFLAPAQSVPPQSTLDEGEA